MDTNVFVIAEAGVNHNGDRDIAFRLVDAAITSGADAVKFQTFKASEVASKSSKKASYQLTTTNENESQLEMLEKLELTYDLHYELKSYCDSNDIEFMSTAFDIDSLNFLVRDLKIEKLKIPSGEITNAPLVLEYAKKGLDMILSTGMATLGEIEQTLGILAFGLAEKGQPGIDAFESAYISKKGQDALKSKVSLLHCTSEYPAALSNINIRAISTLKKAFGLPTGYSDHSLGILVPIVAVTQGATIIEKHFTLDRNMEGPDHKASLEPNELKSMVDSIRSIDEIMGNGLKIPTEMEIAMRPIARKRLVASKKILSGEKFSSENVAILRAESGSSPFLYWEVLKKTAARDYEKDEPIDL